MRNLFHALRPRSRNAVHAGLYQYFSGAIFTPGAQAQVFEPAFTLPITSVIGNGVSAGSSPNPLAFGPQVFAANPKPIAGLGGLVAGQFVPPGPLLDSQQG